MAIITTDTRLKIGFDQRIVTAGSTVVISSTAGGLALPFIAQFTGNITRVAVSSSIIVTAITNLDIGIMASNATGDLPSDTFLASPNTTSFSTVSTPTLYNITLTNPVSITTGTVYWLVLKPNSSFTGNGNFYYNYTTLSNYFTYRTANRVSSAWSRQTSQGSVAIYGSSTAWYSNDWSGVPDATFNTTVAANQEYGVAFTLDANHPAVRLERIGFAHCITQNGTNTAMSIICKIYNAAGTLLYTFDTVDTDRLVTTAGQGHSFFVNSSGSDIYLEPSTKYYLMIAYSGTFTNTPQISTFKQDTTILTANGAYTANYANKSSGGTFTETTTECMMFAIEVNGIRYDDAGSGGGGYVNASPMFSGGFSG